VLTSPPSPQPSENDPIRVIFYFQGMANSFAKCHGNKNKPAKQVFLMVDFSPFRDHELSE